MFFFGNIILNVVKIVRVEKLLSIEREQRTYTLSSHHHTQYENLWDNFQAFKLLYLFSRQILKGIFPFFPSWHSHRYT